MEDEADENGTLTTRHKGPVTQLSLKALARDGGLDVSWPDYRLAVLRYLEGKGVTGVGDLMYNVSCGSDEQSMCMLTVLRL